MGRRGPPCKPTALRILQGNPGRLHLNPEEPHPPAAPLDLAPPAWLDAVAVETWKRIRPDLPWLAAVDLELLAAYCNAVSRMKAAEANIAAHGMIFVIREPGKKGKPGAIKYVQANPHVSIAIKYETQMRNFAAELGLSPAARTRIHVEDPKKKKPDANLFFGT